MTELHFDRLEQFRREVNYNLMFGNLADSDLPVVDDQGQSNVVVALAEEQLMSLFRRVEDADGYANIFVKDDDEVVMLTSLNDTCSLIADEAEDMTGDDRPSLLSTVGIFVDYLRHQENGVRLPAHRGETSTPKLSVGGEVEFA